MKQIHQIYIMSCGVSRGGERGKQRPEKGEEVIVQSNSRSEKPYT